MQVDQINTFIAQGVDAIIINPANPQETVTSALDDCAASWYSRCCRGHPA